MSEISTVAVVGAGFSGLLTALRLLLAPDGPRVVLIEKGPRFGRGAAYSTASPDHLLNVRATNMSALVEQPSHFLDWLGKSGVAAPEQVFVTRDRYGRYLQSLLREATADTAAGRLSLEHDEIISLRPDGDRWRLDLAMGRELIADAVVLALGALPPAPPRGLDPLLLSSERYVADPWAWGGPGVITSGDVLLVGSGLTAVDVALMISGARPDARVMGLSRHGLLPRRHGDATIPFGGAGALTGTPRAMLREVRRRARVDWRGAVDGVRPHVQAIWRGWPLVDRRRFLRHLRPWWNVYRHRLAPEVAARIERLQVEDRFSVAAGSIESLTLRPDGVDLVWTPRAHGEPRTRRFAQVINCTGPGGHLTEVSDPLISSLVAAGLARTDACALGVDVDARSRVIGASGDAAETLFAVGPLTRGEFYEIASVPDIRLQAADCADSILGRLALNLRAETQVLGEDRSLEDLAAFIDQSIAELDVELGSLKFARRVRGAWELRGRRAALGEIALWLDERNRRK
jgi:uncharacterized NAD(P)/FAD-binding protein YdhS